MSDHKIYQIENFTEEGYGEIIDNSKKYLVKNTLKGEMIKLKIEKNKKNQLAESIIEPVIFRQKPICKHFLLCGNCQLQQLDQNLYKKFKINILEKYLKKANYNIYPEIKFIQSDHYSRRRASFIVDYNVTPISIGFFQEFSNKIINIEECFIVTENIFKIIKSVRDNLGLLLKKYNIFRIIITEIDEKLDIILEHHVFFDNEIIEILKEFSDKHKISRIISNFTNILNIIIQRENIKKIGEDYEINLPANYFIQATKKMEDILVEIIPKWVKKTEKILDLYSGFGFLSMKLAQLASIHCYEISQSMINAIKEASNLYKRNFPINASQRDLDLNPLKPDYINNFDHIIINPPRKGCYKQIKEIAKSNCKKITLISCEVVNFSRDIYYLNQANYKITEIIIIDQFLYSSHLEFILLLTKS